MPQVPKAFMRGDQRFDVAAAVDVGRVGAGFPDEITELKENRETGEYAASGGVSFGGKSLKAKMEASLKRLREKKRGVNKKYTNYSVSEIANVSRENNLVFFLDNFHYIPENSLIEISQTLRSAIEDGLRCCIAYVPQKSDIILQGNNDLNNKATKIRVDTWTESELAEIARLGFEKLNRQVDQTIINRLAREACFSP